MRTTVRIDDDVLRELKERAHRANQSLTKVLDQVIRQGLAAYDKSPRPKRFRQTTHSMGQPLVDLTKALALAAQLEDEEILAKMARHQ